MNPRPVDLPAMTIAIDASLVRQLVAAQFPHWADLPITPAVPQGWDNRTFRLGADLSVRVPSAAGYVPQVEKEHRYLPRLAPLLPLPIPVPLAQATPSPGRSTGGSPARPPPPRASTTRARSRPRWRNSSPPCSASIPRAARRPGRTTSSAAVPS